MTKRDAWLALFPLRQADDAVKAVLQGWEELVAMRAEGFTPDVDEPDLTLVLINHLRYTVSPGLGLMGNWGAEDVGGDIDRKTLKVIRRHRTDIKYSWNDEKRRLEVVFEFKKLDKGETSRKHYYGDRGMLRFVTGPYSKGHPVALMAGILLGAHDECVPGLEKALKQPAVSSLLRICPADGQVLHRPSKLFREHARFDTEHTRPAALAPQHGTIRIAHLFLSFPEDSLAARRKKRQRKADLEAVMDEPMKRQAGKRS